MLSDKVMNATVPRSYRVVTVVQPPFVMYDKDEGKYYGLCIDLLNDIREIMGFDYEIREIEDQLYGNLGPNGTWNGMIEELIENRTDIALSALWMTVKRQQVVDFTVPYYDRVGFTIMMLKTKTTTSLFKFLTVLDNQVWFCILGSYFLTSVLLWLFDRYSPYSYQKNLEKYKDDDEKRVFNLRESLWFCVTSLTPQGGGDVPKNLSGRLVATTWWLFGFVIVASYTGNLAAFLTVSRLGREIETLDDLGKQYRIKYAPVLHSPAYTYFNGMVNIERSFYEIWKGMSLNESLSDMERMEFAVWDYPVNDKYTKLWQAMAVAEFPRSTEEALRRVRRLDSDEEFAYIENAATIRYHVMRNCDLIQVGEEFSRKPYAIAVQRGSPLKEQLNDAILELQSKKRLGKLKDTWWKNNSGNKNCDAESDQSDGISIHDIGGVFIIIPLGIIFAWSMLMFEYCYYRYHRKVQTI